MTIGERIKKMREENHLSQGDVAKKIFTTNKTISNYELGLRTPGVDVLQKLSVIFGVSMEYFTDVATDTGEESRTLDLQVVRNSKGKEAIFDTKQSKYLTPHLYARITIGSCGHHICLKAEGDDLDEIESAERVDIVDNNGNVTNFDENIYMLSNRFSRFNDYGTARAYLKNENCDAIVDYRGNILFKSKNRIHQAFHPIETIHAIRSLDDENAEEEIYRTLIDSNPAVYISYVDVLGNKVEISDKFIKSIDYYIDLIDKHGFSIALIIPEVFYKNIENVYKILLAYFKSYLKFVPEEFKKTMYSRGFDMYLKEVISRSVKYADLVETEDLINAKERFQEELEKVLEPKIINKVERNYYLKSVYLPLFYNK